VLNACTTRVIFLFPRRSMLSFAIGRPFASRFARLPLARFFTTLFRKSDGCDVRRTRDRQRAVRGARLNASGPRARRQSLLQRTDAIGRARTIGRLLFRSRTITMRPPPHPPIHILRTSSWAYRSRTVYYGCRANVLIIIIVVVVGGAAGYDVVWPRILSNRSSPFARSVTVTLRRGRRRGSKTRTDVERQSLRSRRVHDT
jgi:hypothetical protein